MQRRPASLVLASVLVLSFILTAGAVSAQTAAAPDSAASSLGRDRVLHAAAAQVRQRVHGHQDPLPGPVRLAQDHGRHAAARGQRVQAQGPRLGRPGEHRWQRQGAQDHHPGPEGDGGCGAEGGQGHRGPFRLPQLQLPAVGVPGLGQRRRLPRRPSSSVPGRVIRSTSWAPPSTSGAPPARPPRGTTTTGRPASRAPG